MGKIQTEGSLKKKPSFEFSKIYADHKENVWALVCRYVFSPEDREDLFQEVFIRIHQALPRFRGEAQLGTWIYRIVVNTSLNYLKKQQRHRRIKNLLIQFKVDAETVEEKTRDIQLAKPLAKLNVRQKMILILADVEEQGLEEISRVLKIPVGTVKSNLFRAREIIRKELIQNGSL